MFKRNSVMLDSDLKSNRPLSPHLQVYKMILTMLMSVVHRVTGIALYFGTVLMVVWLLAIASGPQTKFYFIVSAIYSSWLGQLVLFGFTWALIHHMLGGLRHFVWDLGFGFSKEASNTMAKLTIFGSVIITLALWLIIFWVR